MTDSLRDQKLGMGCPISRRDFLNGVAVTVGAGLIGGTASAASIPADNQGPSVPGTPPLGKGADDSTQEALLEQGITPKDPRYYPPILTRMRGNHPGSFEAAHADKDGAFWNGAAPAEETHETYDLVVVGGGISGLAAAYFFRARTGPKARILVLDNHDDFGGHAKRNEFHLDGRMLLMNGGTMSIESPFDYSPEAAGLFADLGIDPPTLQAKCAKPGYYHSLGLRAGVFFDKETFGVDRLVAGEPGRAFSRGEATNAQEWEDFLKKTPLSPEAQRDIVRLQTAATDYMPGLTELQKKRRLCKMSYKDFLLKVVKVHPDVITFYQTSTWGLYGVGIDAVSALDLWAEGYMGFQGLGLQRVKEPGFLLSFTAQGDVVKKKPYYFHFPDGNASVARLLMRALIPASAPGNTAEDIVTAKFDYSRLDEDGAPVRIRLNSPVVRVRHVGDPATAKEVEIVYAQRHKVYSVRGKVTILACYNEMIPVLCPEMPARQKRALGYGSKVPLIYTTVALKNWRAFQKLGVQNVSCPGMYHNNISLNSVVDIGDYTSPKTPDEPILVHMLRTPCNPGLPARDQQRMGRFELFRTSFETFERNIRDQMARVLGEGGFDASRDIAAITVNRWSHGYAYEYTPLWDPGWPPGQQPCEIARRRFGRIAVANSDAAAAAYTDQAIDQGSRAVGELLALGRQQTEKAIHTSVST